MRTQRTLCSQEEIPLKDVTERIISCAIEVHKALVHGLLENVYEEALAYEFILRGIKYIRPKLSDFKTTECTEKNF